MNSCMTVCNSRGFRRGVGVVGGWIRAIALVVVVLAGYSRAEAQCPAGWLEGQGWWGVNGEVNAVAVLPGGDVIAGGAFTTAGNLPANKIARFNQAAGLWSPLGSGLSGGDVWALVVLPGGDVIAGGVFTTAGGVSASRIARFNTATGVWSALGSGTNSGVYALAVLPGGDVLVGGDFTTAGGVVVNNIARYNPMTGVWSALGSGTSGGVRALAVLPGGDVIVGGFFTTAGGVPASSIARYNPTTGVWSALGGGTSGGVSALAVLPGGNVLVGGSFTTAGSVPANRIARYNITTGVWSSLGSGVNSTVSALVALPGGDVLVGGYFTSAGGAPANFVARCNPTTGVWSALGSGVNSGLSFPSVRALAVLPGGDVILGGFFDSAGGLFPNRIARYNPSTGAWSTLGRGVNWHVYTLALLQNGELMVGGLFSSVRDVPVNRIARYNPATGAWSSLGSGISGLSGTGNGPLVQGLAVLPDGDVIVGGNFTNAGGVPANNIARYNPATGVWSALGSGVSSANFATPLAKALAVLPSGDLIVGGRFSTAGGVPANNIARYNFSTGVWSALGTGVNSVVDSMVVLPNGHVLVGGLFTTAGGVSSQGIARYNPVTGVWSALGSGVGGQNAYVASFAVLPGGDVLVGGYFFTAGNLPANGIARYNPSTGVWSAVGSGVSWPIPYITLAMVLLPGGDVIMGGTSINGGNAIARYSPATGVWSALGSGVGHNVFTLALLPGGDVIAGGSFSQAGAFPTMYLARYTFGTPAPTIATHPVPQSACVAGSAAFAVTPAGTGPFTYQWRKGVVAINATTNPSAATATLTLANVQAGDAGSYDCVVSTPCGSVTSNAVSLTVASCACGLSDVAGPGQSVGSDSVLTADDIIVYLNWFFAGDTRADVAGPGQSSVPDSQFTADDIIVFLNRFFAGC